MKSAKRFWVLAIIFGLAAAGVAYLYTQQVKEAYVPDDLINVVVAATDIPRDSIVTLEQVTVKQVPAKFSHPDAARRVEQVVGKIATSNIVTGQEILTKAVLADRAKATKPSYVVPEGKRAVSISVNDVSGVSGLIRPGDRVDVFGTFSVDAFNGTALVLQNIEVLAVGSQLAESAPAGQEQQKGSAATLTVAVTPADARPLIVLSEQGSLRLALRSPVDEGRVVLAPYAFRQLLGQQ